ncbi:MAG: DUF2232 domain-containing protein [Candidatus Cloacimonetes bacterium]|nr:DUF2232 domain-containing protein [Candidatus Cloacimonadota bacterium]
MIVIVFFSVLISLISPFWGLIFIMTVGVKYQYQPYRIRFYTAMIFVLLLFLLGRIINIISFSDILVGVILSAFVFFMVFSRTLEYLRAILTAGFINLVYSALRQAAFGKLFLENINQIFDLYLETLRETTADNINRLAFIQEAVESVRDIITNFFPGIWVFTIIVALYLGALLLSRRSQMKWKHKYIRLPFFLIYLLLPVLVLMLFPATRIAGFNGALMLLPVFLIQGISLIDFYWGAYFHRTRLLLIVFVLALVFNPYLVLLLTLFGLFDIWFDFRKINKREEIDENHPD